jgi:hypothetical protein
MHWNDFFKLYKLHEIRFHGSKKRGNLSLDRPWRPTGLWHVEVPTFSKTIC